jgi:hypothetical protein
MFIDSFNIPKEISSNILQSPFKFLYILASQLTFCLYMREIIKLKRVITLFILDRSSSPSQYVVGIFITAVQGIRYKTWTGLMDSWIEISFILDSNFA